MTGSATWARPRWSTPRDPSCPTLGPAVGRVASRLGMPLLPWQQHVADVMGEVENPDAPPHLRRMRYPLVVLVVPRRGGKTALTFATSLQRAGMARGRRVWYTAQTGGDAGDTMVNEWLPMLDGTPYAASTRKRLSNGSQGLTIPSRGSRIGIFPPTRKALHGKDADYVTVDEAWSFTDEEGLTLEAAIRPATQTRLGRQVVIVSAGGTAESTWLLRLRDLGRRAVDEGSCRASGLAFVEFTVPHVQDDSGAYRVDPDVDLDDPAVWADTHPAVGYTIDLDTLRQDRQTMDPATFHRSTLNVFQVDAAERVITAAEWSACRDESAAVDGRVRLAFDVGDDLGWSAITVSSRRPDGRVVTELADYRPGSAWLVDTVKRMRMQHRATLHATGDGPVVEVVETLTGEGVPVDVLGPDRYATACAALLADVRAGRTVHRGQPALDVAVGGATRSIRGDRWVWTRRRSAVDIAPLVAATVSAAAARSGASQAPSIRYREGAGSVSSLP